MGIHKIFVPVILAGATLFGLALLLPAASAIQSRAEVLLEREVQQYQKAFTYGSQTEIRLKQGASALVEAVGMWNRDAALIFPDQSFAPHIYDVAIMRNLVRLETLRAAAQPHAWEPFNVDIDSLFFCSNNVYSVCLLISTQELATGLGVSKDQLVQGLFEQSGVSLRSILWLGSVVFVVVGIVGGIWGRRNASATQTANLTVETQAEVETTAAEHLFTMGDLLVDSQRMLITRGTHSANISVRDLKLLSYLYQHPNQVVSKDRLYNAGWGRDFVPSSRSLEQHIATLRKKIDPQRNLDPVIETVHGQGYRFPTESV